MRTLDDLVIDIGKLKGRAEKALSVAPVILGQAVAQDIQNNFMLQGLQTDGSFEEWEPSHAAIREGRRTLIKSGALMGAVHYETDDRGVRVGIDTRLVPYGEQHNEGLNGNVQRQFIYLRHSVVEEAMRKVEQMIQQ